MPAPPDPLMSAFGRFIHSCGLAGLIYNFEFYSVDASGSEALYADLGVTGEIAAGEISTLNCSHQTTTD